MSNGFLKYLNANIDYLWGQTNAEAFDAEYLTVKDQSAQVALDGYVVPVGPGLGVSDAIDPTNTTTPLADAHDLVKSAGEGAVLLPPNTIQEQSTFVWDHPNIDVIGWGATSVVEFTDLSNDGIDVNWSGNTDQLGSLWHNFLIDGSDLANRSGGSGLRFSSSPPAFHVGNLWFRNWPGNAVNLDTGAPYSSTWHNLDFHYGDNHAPVIRVNAGGAPFRIDNIHAETPDTGTTYIDYTNNVVNSSIEYGVINLGGAGKQAMRIKGDPGKGFAKIGQINWEPTDNTNPGGVLDLNDGMTTIVGGMNLVSGTTDYAVKLTYQNENNVIGPITANNTTINSNIINVASDPNGYTWYHGPSGDISVSHGGTLEGEVRSLATAGSGNG